MQSALPHMGKNTEYQDTLMATLQEAAGSLQRKKTIANSMSSLLPLPFQASLEFGKLVCQFPQVLVRKIVILFVG